MSDKIKRIILLQIIFFLLASLFIPFGIISDVYLRKHLVHTQSLGNFTYDNKIATKIGKIRDSFSNNDLLIKINSYSYRSSRIFVKNGRFRTVLSDIIYIIFWMIFMNILFFATQNALWFRKKK